MLLFVLIAARTSRINNASLCDHWTLQMQGLVHQLEHNEAHMSNELRSVMQHEVLNSFTLHCTCSWTSAAVECTVTSRPALQAEEHTKLPKDMIDNTKKSGKHDNVH